MEVKITDKNLRRAGLRMVEIILTRTAWGIDKDGKPFKDYSTRPFKMPSGAIPKRTRRVLFKNGQLYYFKKGKALWCVIKDGYLSLKKAIYSRTSYTGTPNLMLSGRMLGSVTVTSVGDNKVFIGFNRTEEAQKAMWNAEKGREFMGLTQDDLEDDVLLEQIASGVVFTNINLK